MTFDQKDISILIHGRIENQTDSALKSIRKLFPLCKIILSTWKKSNVSKLDYDLLVENDDPGAEIFNAPKNSLKDKNGNAIFEIDGKKYVIAPKPNNVNRIIQTITNGIKYVKTKYLLRIRTDIILKNANFLNYWNKFPKYNGRYKIFKHRIINSSSFAQFAHVMDDGIQLLPFHMSDWIHFGFTEDIKLLYSCPFHNIEDSSQYWYKRKRKKYEPFLNAGWQYPPETYVLYSLVKQKFPEVEFRDSDDYNCKNMTISNMVMADNFIFVDQENFSFDISKYPQLKKWNSEIYDGFITYREFQNLYRIYCDKKYTFWDIDFNRFSYCKKLLSVDYLFKYPKKYFRLLKDLFHILNKSSLRKKFYVGKKYEN